MVINMRNLLIVFSLTMFMLTAPIAAPSAQAQPEAIVGTDGFADLAEDLLPSVVNISSTHKPVEVEDYPDMPHFPPGSPFEDFFEEFMDRRGMGMPSIPPASLGSGFVIDAENGYIVTNNHVVKDADEVRVTFHDDVTVEAEVIGRDEKIDLAVLKIETDHEMVAVPFGNSDKLRIGNWIIAIGNPFGLGGSVTAGIVSAQQRDIQSGPYDDFIQTDASINRGNSGGPMFNLKGEVIGINTAIFSPSGGSVGIGFAIPSNLAKPVIRQLIEFGRTRRGWLGVRIQSVTDEIADSLGLKEAKGALVASTTKDGPAQKAGLEAGDIIVGFNGRKIDEMRDLPRMVAETPIGDKIEIVYWRDGKERKSTVKIGELEKAEENGLLTQKPKTEAKADDGLSIDTVGLTLRNILPMDREQYNIDDEVSGVLISGVEPMSEAAEKGMGVGDVIVEINQQPVKDAVKVKDIIEKAQKGGRSSVLLLVNRNNDVSFVALRLKT